MSVDCETVEKARAAAWLHPFVAFEEFQGEPLPIRSEWPTCAEPDELLVQLLASMVGGTGVSAAVPLRSRENFVLNRWRIAEAVNDLSMLVARGLLE